MAEVSLTDENLSQENRDALDDLLVSIEASGGRLGIYIAVCDDPQLKEEIISRYEQELAPAFRHYRLTLNANEPSLKALLTQQVKEDAYLQPGARAVMNILGAEGLRTLRFEAAQSQQETFFGYLQWTREGLQDFPFAIVLWVTYQLQEQLSLKAPDFWSWRRDVVRFVSPKRQAISTDELASLRGHEQFSHFEAVGNTLPIYDLEALIAETATKSPDSALLASLYLQTGRAYVSRVEAGRAQDYKGEIEKATTYLKTAAELLKSSDDLEEYADSLDGLARAYKIRGRYSEAEPLYVEALEISKAELGDRHPSTASSLNNLALLYYSQGRYVEAEPLFVEALEISKTELGDRHPSTAGNLNNLAELYRLQGRYVEAEPLLVEALKISKTELGDRHPSTALSLNNLAGLYESQGRYVEAEPLYVEALEISKTELGDRHPSTALSLNNLALLYESQGRYVEAEPLYVEALEIRKTELGDRHPDTATSLFNLAVLYHQTNRQQQALSLIQQALDIYIPILGSNHPTTEAARSWLKPIQQAINQPSSTQG